MDIKIPDVGESVFEALVAKWHRQDGEQVSRDEPVCEIETDKITLEINAEADGILRIKVPEGTQVKIGSVIGVIEETGTGDRRPGTGKPGVGGGGVAAGKETGKEMPALEKKERETVPSAARHVSPSER